jgi:hypothetical protein
VLALVFAPAQIHRICVGQQKVSPDQVLRSSSNFAALLNMAAFTWAQLGSRANLHDVAHSYDAVSAIPADEIPIMAGIWFCLHSSALIS